MKLNKNKPRIQYYVKISLGNKGEKRVHCHKTWPKIIDRGISSNSRVVIPEENWNLRKEGREAEMVEYLGKSDKLFLFS